MDPDNDQKFCSDLERGIPRDQFIASGLRKNSRSVRGSGINSECIPDVSHGVNRIEVRIFHALLNGWRETKAPIRYPRRCTKSVSWAFLWGADCGLPKSDYLVGAPIRSMLKSPETPKQLISDMKALIMRSGRKFGKVLCLFIRFSHVRAFCRCQSPPVLGILITKCCVTA